jgi:hypothetical protein
VNFLPAGTGQGAAGTAVHVVSDSRLKDVVSEETKDIADGGGHALVEVGAYPAMSDALAFTYSKS